MKELLADIKRNTAAVTPTTVPDPATRKYLQETLWPFLQGLVENVTEALTLQSEAINGIVNEESDELIFESTAAEILEPLVKAVTLLGVFGARLEHENTKEAKKLLKEIAIVGVLARKVAEDILPEITIPDPDDEEDEDEDDPPDGSEEPDADESEDAEDEDEDEDEDEEEEEEEEDEDGEGDDEDDEDDNDEEDEDDDDDQ